MLHAREIRYASRMSRYRPARPKSSPYITPEGEAALRKELHQLWKVERPVVTAAVQAAAANGDRSENGDYIYGKKRLREIDSRVRFLRKRLDTLQVVTTLPSDTSKIYFGASVTVESPDGEQEHWRIVGPDEFDLRSSKLSCDAPLARALLGKSIDDVAVVHSPKGETEWLVIDVTYNTTTAD
jgi:transcription elongation factor GreB